MREVLGRTRLRVAPFATAVSVAALLVLSAPFVGQFRSYLRAAFPGQFVRIVGASVALAAGAALLAALLRIRERRLIRYAAVAAALLIAAAYSAFRAGPNPESNVVERFHFVQYGLVTFLFYRAWRPLGDPAVVLLPVFAGLLVSTAEEWLQWFIPNRVGEIDDVVLNLVAIGTGLLFSVAVHPPALWRGTVGASSRRMTARLAAATLIALGLFFHVVHLGHWIEDPDAGTFASRYTRRDLLAHQARRAEQWKASPPPLTVARLSVEDQYLTEGIQHVRWRNTKWAEGDVSAAWHENRILEMYYAPVLDTPTHEGTAGHRWPAEQRADADGRRGTAAGYVSDAYPYPVFAWNRVIFWTVLLATAALLVASALRADS